MITQVELAGIAVTAAAAIATIAGVIKNWETIKIWWKKTQENRRLRFARKQYPICSTFCTAPSNMSKILTRLDEMFTFIQVTRDVAIETHGMALIDKCKEACEKGYMLQSEKDDVIHSLIPYVIGCGNGKVFNYVQMSMNLPTHPDGHNCDVDLDEIITREIDKYEKRKKVI